MLDENLDLKIYLMSGTANTFAITSFMSKDSATNLHKVFKVESLNELASKFCNFTDVDGFIILTDSDNKDNDYKWLFFNRDGSPAEMCGNAARCVGHLTFKNHIAGQEHSFESSAGDISVLVENEERVTVGMTKIKNLKKDLVFDFNNQTLNYTHLDTGVPHCVFKIESFDQLGTYKAMAAKLRNNKELYPNGSNVTFYSVTSNVSIQSATFERGVEDFTQACGTGAVAAAFCHQQEVDKDQIEVNMPGGRVFVDFSKITPYLIGPIKYNSTLFPEDIEDLWTNSFTA